MLTLRDALTIIFKRKMIIFVFMIALVGAAFATLKIMKPTYAATSKVLVKIGREDVYTPSMEADALVSPLMAVIRKEQLNSEIQILTSDNLGEKLIAEMKPEGLYPGLYDKFPIYTFKGMFQTAVWTYKQIENYFAPLTANPTGEQIALKRFISKDLKVFGTGDSNVIDVTVRSKIPEIAADAANKLVNLYLVERMRIHEDSEGAVFEEKLEEMNQRLSNAESKLETFRQSHKVLQDEPQRKKLQQDVDILKKSRELYLEKVEEYRINTALSDKRIGNVSIISEAIVPSTPIGPKLWLIMLVILAVGPIGGIALAFLAELLDDTVESDNDVRKYLDLPVLGKVGYLR